MEEEESVLRGFRGRERERERGTGGKKREVGGGTAEERERGDERREVEPVGRGGREICWIRKRKRGGQGLGGQERWKRENEEGGGREEGRNR